MAGYNRPEGGWTMTFNGMNVTDAPDHIEPTQYPVAVNIRSIADRSVRTRPGYELFTEGTTLEIVSDCPPGGFTGVIFEYLFIAIGGVGPYTWSIASGALPNGVELDPVTGAISGVPTEAGDFTFTIQATDANLNTATKPCGLTIIDDECSTFSAPVLWESLGAGELGGTIGSFNSLAAVSASANWINVGVTKTTGATASVFAFAPRTPTPGPTSWTYKSIAPLTADSCFGVFALSDDVVYVATTLPNNCQVLRFDRTANTMTNLSFPDNNVDRIVINGSTTDPDILYVMTQARLLAAGSDGAVLWTYKISTATWTQIGGDGINSSWNLIQNNSQVVNVSEGTDGFLYVSLAGGTVNLAQVWRGDAHVSPTTWLKIAGNGENSGWVAGTLRALRVLWHDGYLYAGLQGASNGDAKGWRWNGSVWNQICGGGINGSWPNGTKLGCAQIFAQGNMLGFGISSSITDGDAEVWFCSTTDYQFTQNAGDGLNGSWTGRRAVSASLIDPFLEGYLYIGLGNILGTGILYGTTIPCAE